MECTAFQLRQSSPRAIETHKPLKMGKPCLEGGRRKQGRLVHRPSKVTAQFRQAPVDCCWKAGESWSFHDLVYCLTYLRNLLSPVLSCAVYSLTGVEIGQWTGLGKCLSSIRTPIQSNQPPKSLVARPVLRGICFYLGNTATTSTMLCCSNSWPVLPGVVIREINCCYLSCFKAEGSASLLLSCLRMCCAAGRPQAQAARPQTSDSSSTSASISTSKE